MFFNTGKLPIDVNFDEMPTLNHHVQQESIPNNIMMPPLIPPKKNKGKLDGHAYGFHALYNTDSEVDMAEVVAHVLPSHSNSPLAPVLPPKPMNNTIMLVMSVIEFPPDS